MGSGEAYRVEPAPGNAGAWQVTGPDGGVVAVRDERGARMLARALNATRPRHSTVRESGADTAAEQPTGTVAEPSGHDHLEAVGDCGSAEAGSSEVAAAATEPSQPEAAAADGYEAFAFLDSDGEWKAPQTAFVSYADDPATEGTVRFAKKWPRSAMTRNGIAKKRVGRLKAKPVGKQPQLDFVYRQLLGDRGFAFVDPAWGWVGSAITMVRQDVAKEIGLSRRDKLNKAMAECLRDGSTKSDNGSGWLLPSRTFAKNVIDSLEATELPSPENLIDGMGDVWPLAADPFGLRPFKARNGDVVAVPERAIAPFLREDVEADLYLRVCASGCRRVEAWRGVDAVPTLIAAVMEYCLRPDGPGDGGGAGPADEDPEPGPQQGEDISDPAVDGGSAQPPSAAASTPEGGGGKTAGKAVAKARVDLRPRADGRHSGERVFVNSELGWAANTGFAVRTSAIRELGVATGKLNGEVARHVRDGETAWWGGKWHDGSPDGVWESLSEHIGFTVPPDGCELGHGREWMLHAEEPLGFRVITDGDGAKFGVHERFVAPFLRLAGASLHLRRVGEVHQVEVWRKVNGEESLLAALPSRRLSTADVAVSRVEERGTRGGAERAAEVADVKPEALEPRGYHFWHWLFGGEHWAYDFGFLLHAAEEGAFEIIQAGRVGGPGTLRSDWVEATASRLDGRIRERVVHALKVEACGSSPAAAVKAGEPDERVVQEELRRIAGECCRAYERMPDPREWRTALQNLRRNSGAYWMGAFNYAVDGGGREKVGLPDLDETTPFLLPEAERIGRVVELVLSADVTACSLANEAGGRTPRADAVEGTPSAAVRHSSREEVVLGFDEGSTRDAMGSVPDKHGSSDATARPESFGDDGTESHGFFDFHGCWEPYETWVNAERGWAKCGDFAVSYEAIRRFGISSGGGWNEPVRESLRTNESGIMGGNCEWQAGLGRHENRSNAFVDGLEDRRRCHEPFLLKDTGARLPKGTASDYWVALESRSGHRAYVPRPFIHAFLAEGTYRFEWQSQCRRVLIWNPDSEGHEELLAVVRQGNPSDYMPRHQAEAFGLVGEMDHILHQVGGTDEAAEILGKSEKWTRELCQKGRIKRAKRIKTQWVVDLRWLREHRDEIVGDAEDETAA